MSDAKDDIETMSGGKPLRLPSGNAPFGLLTLL